MMNKRELLFYEAYEAFYAMAESSQAFRNYCIDAFGQDFSQDGFSDLTQIDMILQYLPAKEDIHILDIGCGNGKMLGYLQKRTGASIYGFDYSENAVRTAKYLFPERAQFKVGIIGETEYPDRCFDVVISMDTLYFAKDIKKLMAQIKKWLKDDGVFFAGYQEGDVIPRTEGIHTTMLAHALRANDMKYDAVDITRQTYEMLKRKRMSALAYRKQLTAEGNGRWFDMLMGQTECVRQTYEQFHRQMARYIYVARKM